MNKESNFWIRKTNPSDWIAIIALVLFFLAICVAWYLNKFPLLSLIVTWIGILFILILILWAIFSFEWFQLRIFWIILSGTYLRWKYVPVGIENALKSSIVWLQKYLSLLCCSVLFSWVFFISINQVILHPGIEVYGMILLVGQAIKDGQFLLSYIFWGIVVLAISFATWRWLIFWILWQIWVITWILFGTYVAFLMFWEWNHFLNVANIRFWVHQHIPSIFAWLLFITLIKWTYAPFFKVKGERDWLEYFKGDLLSKLRLGGNEIRLLKYIQEEILSLARNKNAIPFFFDSPITKGIEDELNVKQKASEIFDLIYKSKLQKNTQAVSIWIEGAWGSWKTSLVNILKHDHLDKVQGSVVYFEFNVWQHSWKLSESFFSEFKNFLVNKKIIDSKLEAKFDTYIEKLSGLHPVANIIQLTNGIFATQNTIKDIYKEISEAIIKSEKRIVVIIDDIDRLWSWDQWNEIFSIQRASANFSNVFFVMCFSNEQLCRIWKEKYEKVSTTDVIVDKSVRCYTEKVFNLVYEMDAITEATRIDTERTNLKIYYEKLVNESVSKTVVDEYLRDEDFKNAAINKLLVFQNKVIDIRDEFHEQLSKADFKNVNSVLELFIENSYKNYLSNELFSNDSPKISQSQLEMNRSRTPRYIKILANRLLTFFYGVSTIQWKLWIDWISIQTWGIVKKIFLNELDEAIECVTNLTSPNNYSLIVLNDSKKTTHFLIQSTRLETHIKEAIKI